MCKLNKLCEKGSLFKLVCSLDGVQSFIRHFKIRSATGTVMNKAFHLLRLSKFAESHFSEMNDSVRKGQMLSIIEYLHTVAKTFKNESRREASIRKENETRIGSGMFLTESDIGHYASAGLDILNDIIESCRSMYAEQGDRGVSSTLSNKKKLVKKWCLNFVSTLMLHGCGQRPQVYTMIQAPSVMQLVELRDSAKNSGVFCLRTSYEKRVRCVDLPHVLFPRSVYRILNFHVNYILPSLYETHGVEEGDPRRNCLNLHTETGEPLDSRQVTACLRTFLKSYDPELARVSTMTLRASFATAMLRKHRRGEKFGDMREEDFIEYLAKIMNTSAEQLKDTYIASDESSFKACAEIVHKMLETKNDDTNLDDSDLVLF